MLAAAIATVVITAMVKNTSKKLVKHSVYAFFLDSNVKSKKGFVGNKEDSCLFMRLCVMIKNMGIATQQILFRISNLSVLTV